MIHPIRYFERIAIWMLPIWTAMLFVSTLTHQPDPLTAFPDFASYVTTDRFLWSHLINSIAGAAIGTIGVIALLLYLQDTRAAGKAISGTVATVVGNTLTTSIFGVAAFAQPAMGRMFQAGQENAAEFYNQVYGAPLFGTAILGLLLFIVGGVLIGIAIASSGLIERWVGWVYALTTAGFAISNFFFPPLVTSGLLVLLVIATVVVAWRVGRERRIQYASAGTAM